MPTVCVKVIATYFHVLSAILIPVERVALFPQSYVTSILSTANRPQANCLASILLKLAPGVNVLTHAPIDPTVICKLDAFPQSIRSLVPSNTMFPPFAVLKVGPFTKVPLLPPRLKSVHVVPVPG